MGINITRDLFQRHDPLSFDDEKVAALAEKHGIRPHWCNAKWRDDRRGWNALDPIPASDPRFDDVYACLLNRPRDPKRKIRDGYYRQGANVLSVQSVEEWELSQARRDFLANRRMHALREGNPVQEALALEANAQGIEAPKPVMSYTDDKGRELHRDRPGKPVRGFVNMNKREGEVPSIRSGDYNATRKEPKSEPAKGARVSSRTGKPVRKYTRRKRASRKS